MAQKKKESPHFESLNGYPSLRTHEQNIFDSETLRKTLEVQIEQKKQKVKAAYEEEQRQFNQQFEMERAMY